MASIPNKSNNWKKTEGFLKIELNLGIFLYYSLKFNSKLSKHSLGGQRNFGQFIKREMDKKHESRESFQLPQLMPMVISYRISTYSDLVKT